MTFTDDSELDALRQRVYGPHAGAEPDAAAIRRLQQLEAARRPVVPEQTASPDPVETVEVAGDAWEPLVEPAEPWGKRLVARLRRARPSTVLIAFGVLAFVTAIALALTLVQRVQADPLQTGAEQVARLGVDSAFPVPILFRGGTNGDGQLQGYQGIWGLRSVVTVGGIFGTGSDEPCLAVYSEADIKDPEINSIDGPLVGGCAVGGFPAVAQFASDLEGFPEELTEAFPDATGLQFVYDSVNNEVVVFASP